MSQVILRRTKDAIVSASDAITFVTDTVNRGRVLSCSGNNVLVEIPAAKVGMLTDRLPGWIVSEQISSVPRPDARIRARKR